MGLVRPWWVLWFMDTINRLKVIKLYGSIATVGWFIWLSLSFFTE